MLSLAPIHPSPILSPFACFVCLARISFSADRVCTSVRASVCCASRQTVSGRRVFAAMFRSGSIPPVRRASIFTVQFPPSCYLSSPRRTSARSRCDRYARRWEDRLTHRGTIARDCAKPAARCISIVDRRLLSPGCRYSVNENEERNGKEAEGARSSSQVGPVYTHSRRCSCRAKSKSADLVSRRRGRPARSEKTILVN